MNSPNLTSFLKKTLHQVRVAMGDGSPSPHFCDYCYGTAAKIRGIHEPVIRCECFCHDARKLLKELERGDVHEYIEFEDLRADNIELAQRVEALTAQLPQPQATGAVNRLEAALAISERKYNELNEKYYALKMEMDRLAVAAPANPILTAVSEVLQSEQGPDLEQFLTEYIEAWRKAAEPKAAKWKTSRG